MKTNSYGLELKFNSDQDKFVAQGNEIAGYASLFDVPDEGNDILIKGAFADGLKAIQARNQKVKMLWQHDPAAPIGVWDEVYEDEKGLYAKGRILGSLAKGKEALEMLKAGVIDGLSIGYKPILFDRDRLGRRILKKVELWEVSLVTFPMLPEAGAKLVERKQTQAAIADIIQEMRALRRALDITTF